MHTAEWYPEILKEEYQRVADPAKAEPMRRYMKDRFPFLGIQTPVRRRITRAVFNSCSLQNGELRNLIERLYDAPEREMHYGAIDCLEYHGKHVLGPDDLSLVAFMIGMHSWWDSVDGLASRVVGPLVLRNREELESRVDLWGDCENMWFRRTALLYQLKYKEQTDVERLAEHCRTMASDDAFFIQKAIGWALREYAKTDPQWVRAFVDKTTLSGLSRREALKNIGYE